MARLFRRRTDGGVIGLVDGLRLAAEFGASSTLVRKGQPIRIREYVSLGQDHS